MHVHGASTSDRRLALAMGLTIGFVVIEAVAGSFAHSLALLSDAGHNLADALALGLSWYAVRAARRPADSRRTFGHHRVGILAALVNATTLVGMAVLIFWEALRRLHSPEPVAGGLMIAVAAVAIVLNVVISVWLHRDARHDLNIRSAYLHMLGDAISAAGVVVAGIVVARTGAAVADPIVSLLIGTLILWSSWGILTESVDVLLENVPRGLDMAELEQSIKEVHGVLNVHDLHVWTVASGIIAGSCHVVVAEQSVRDGQQVLRSVADSLRHRFGITHTTIQLEVEGCEPDELYCTLRRNDDPHVGHSHHH
ncbi:MAG TPA: cation diffusion facilitator family transporter [Isosphaeraceae bacterium]|jgi:cobalt-zinc-cadmium efflux system protein|nr:cation diffusion facilitator family transporter [Isosphaeraceae bacterium]